MASSVTTNETQQLVTASSLVGSPSSAGPRDGARTAELKRSVSALSDISDLAPVDTPKYEKFVNYQKKNMKKTQAAHEKWKESFQARKDRVLLRVRDMTERKQKQINNLESALMEAYTRYVMDRNTTDNEKSIERVILSRSPTRNPLNVPQTPVIVRTPGTPDLLSQPSSRPVTRSVSGAPTVRATRTSRERHISSRQ